MEVNPVEMLDGQHVLDWTHSAPLEMLDASSLLATLSADLLPILADMLDSEPAKRLSAPELLRVSCVRSSPLSGLMQLLACFPYETKAKKWAITVGVWLDHYITYRNHEYLKIGEWRQSRYHGRLLTPLPAAELVQTS